MARKSSSQSLVAAGLLILSLIVAVFIWQPVNDDVNRLSEELNSDQLALEQLQAEVSRLQSLEANLPVAESERARILQKVPVGFNQDNLVNDLDELSQSVGVNLNAMSFSQATGDSVAETVTVVGSFTGRYGDLVALLEALEINNRLLKVGSIGVQLSDVNEDGEQLMNFSVTLEAYYQ
jgi:Tfp pilus assembly protein PilO